MKSSHSKSTNFSQQLHILETELEIESDSYFYDDLMALGSDGIVDDPFKRCILQYPYTIMKNVMVIINFSLQYLIPSIVILYFYGKLIKFLNLI